MDIKKVFKVAIVAILFPTTFLFSQVPFKLKKTFRGEMLYPRPITNAAFTKVFRGVYNMNLSLNFGIKNFNVGPYYGLMQCQILPYKGIAIQMSDPHSIQTVHTAGLRFSYDLYPSKEVLQSRDGAYMVFSPFIPPGYDWIDYTRLRCKTGFPSGKHVQTFNLMLGMNINYMITNFEGCGLTLGYNYLAHQFDPKPLCLDQSFLFTAGSEKGMLQYLSFGLNLYIDLGKRPEGSDD